MLYINQLDYPHIKYYHNAANGGPEKGKDNVETSGCGLCCACMMVEHLTTESLALEECVKLSEENGANLKVGTSMRVLGKVVAEKYNLDFSTTNDKEEVLNHLRNGGEVIACVSGKAEGTLAIFTKNEHYIALISAQDETVCILDPSYKEGKFDKDVIRDLMTVKEPFIYCNMDVVMNEAKSLNPAFYLFKRK